MDGPITAPSPMMREEKPRAAAAPAEDAKETTLAT
jgi:small subunit ribosomal protein S6